MEKLNKHTHIRIRHESGGDRGEQKDQGGHCCGRCAAAGADQAGTEAREKTENRWTSFVPIGLGALFFAAALALRNRNGFLSLGLFAAAYLLTGGKVLLRALKNIRRGEIFDENFLMAIASLGAFCIGEYPEAVAVMIFYQVGESFQELALRRSRASITALMDIRPDYANLKRGAELLRVDPRDVHPGDLILVKPGEKIPLDGSVVEGRSALDCSALTGESLPRDVEPGTEVLSGSINKSAVLTVKVTKEFGESTASKILRLVQEAGNRKAPVENFITRFARYYTPAVVGIALALAFIPPLVLSLGGGSAAAAAALNPGETGFIAAFVRQFPSWLHRALVFLVVSCPCALVISVPLSFFGGIGGASRRGILVKGGNYLEALNRADTVVFDKTGTLTRGIFKVTSIVNAPSLSPEELLGYTAAAEQFSNHPIALSIQNAATERGLVVDRSQIVSHQEIPGRGVRLVMGDKTILAGNRRLLEEQGVPCPALRVPGTVVYTACNGTYAGHLEIGDEPKADAGTAIRRLKAAGVRRVLMFTGDSTAAAESMAATLELDGVCGELLPQDKVARLEALYTGDESKTGRETGFKPGNGAKNKGGTIVFVGDGINDAPVLARSDVGVAMGMGQDAAIEAADIVLMTDEPSRLADAVAIARKTHRIVLQNISFALALKGVILILGALGLASMWAAVFGDVGVSIIAILNALRAQRV